MAKHDDLYPLLMAELPGCPTPIIRSALNRAAIEFCKRSLVWQETLDPLPLVPGEWQYEIEVPNGSMVVVVQSAKVNGSSLHEMNDTLGRHPWGIRSGNPSYYALLPEYNAIGVDPVPLAAGDLHLVVALAPTLNATELPQILVSRYHEALSEGAKAFLKRMPNQPWSDPSGAGASHQLFGVKTDEARIGTAYGRTIGSLRVTPRRFA